MTPTQGLADRTASLLVAALEHTWQTIGTRHPEVPPAVLVVRHLTDALGVPPASRLGRLGRPGHSVGHSARRYPT
jgi:hypothetical protein